MLGNHDYMDNPEAQVEFTSSKLNPYGVWQMPAKNYRFSVHAGPKTSGSITTATTFRATRDGAPTDQPSPAVSVSNESTDGDYVSTTGDTLIDLFALDTCGVQWVVNRLRPTSMQELRDNIANLSNELAASSSNAWKIVFGM